MWVLPRRYNSTIFAYGQTGSGKTHTMYGSGSEPGAEGGGEAGATAAGEASTEDGGGSGSGSGAAGSGGGGVVGSRSGLIPRATAYLFSRISEQWEPVDGDSVQVVEYVIKCSCVEIYNEVRVAATAGLARLLLQPRHSPLPPTRALSTSSTHTKT